MAAVMPTSTYPKDYKINEIHYEAKNAAEDATIQANSRYVAGVTAQTYPKVLFLDSRMVKVKDATEEAVTRAYHAQS